MKYVISKTINDCKLCMAWDSVGYLNTLSSVAFQFLVSMHNSKLCFTLRYNGLLSVALSNYDSLDCNTALDSINKMSCLELNSE